MSELLAHDRWSRERLLDHQRAGLRALLSRAVASSPYYREALGPEAAAGEVRLEDLPTLSKATLMGEFDRIVTDPRLRRADLERHVKGPAAAEPHLGEYRVFSTSGTTGRHGLIVYSGDELAAGVAVSLRTLRRIGVTPAMRLVAIGAPSDLHWTRQLFAAFRSGRAESPDLAVTTPLPEMVEALNGYRPDVMITYPTVAAMLAEEQLEGRLRIVPSIIGLGSEVLTDDVARRIRDAWSIVPFDVYASTEAPIIAAESPEHVGLHVSEDLLVVEAVDEHNRPVPPGQPSHKVLVTNLVSHTQPLIRYELSDSVVFADGPDPSGRPYRRILRVDGRNDDVLRLPRPGGGFVAVNPYRLRAPFSGLPEVCQYQIRERGGELRVLVVLRHDAPRDIGARVRAALRCELTDSGALPPRIEVEPVAAIDREAGAGAKLKLVKNDEA